MKRMHLMYAAALLASTFSFTPSKAHAQAEGEPRAIAGIDLGIAVPATDKTWARLKYGATASPYVGYMLDNSFGIQANLHALVFTPDDDDLGFSNEGDLSTLLGLTVGPRLSLPWTENFETYLTGQGGVFGGVSGRLKDEVDGGVSLGGGADFYLTENLALSAYGRWNYVFIQPDPDNLTNNIPDEERNENLQYVTAGIGVKYDFRGAKEAPKPAPVVAKPAPTPAIPAPTKRKIVLRGVRFDFDKADIRPDARAILDEAAKTLKEEGAVAIVVEGHTDARGTEPYNLKLSQRRAAAVRQYLASKGIDASRLTVEAYGESKPVATNDTDEGRAQNRRVELNIKE